METVRLASPWLLLLAAPVWAAVLYRIFTARPRRAGAVPRALLTCMAAGVLAVAVAGPSLRVSREGATEVVILQDVSPSMMPRSAAASAAGAALAPYAAAVPSGRLGLVQFSSYFWTRVPPMSPAVLVKPDAYNQPRTEDTLAATDIARGLEVAGELAAPHGIVLLYTDARETQGDAVRTATQLAARGIQVHAVAPVLEPRDVGIVSLTAPAQVPVGRPIPIEVRLSSTVAAPATVTLIRTTEAAAPAPSQRQERQVTVDPGVPATVLFEDTLSAPALARYEIELASPADDWPENDRASCVVQVGDKHRVLYVYGGEAPGRALELLKAGAGPEADVVAVSAAELKVQDAARSTIVLDNVSAWTLGADRAEELARQVADGGLGLLVLGGDAAFAAGGYGDSPLDDLLPVTSRTVKRPPLELVFVVDSSGSMNEAVGEVRKLTLAKQAVLALRPALADADRVGIVAFAGEPRLASPLVPASDWDTLGRRLRDIQAGGGTRVTPAVEAAVSLFGPPASDSPAVRRLLLVSDGRSDDFDESRLVDACKAARVSVSAVATGPDADRRRLGRLAAETGGRLYESANLAHLAETFLKDMALARGEGVLSGPRPAEWRQPQPIWKTPGPALPPVAAVDPTEAKEGADILWSSPAPAAGQKAAPLLAAWRKGLGRVAAMPWTVSSAEGAWTEGNTLGGYLGSILTGRDPPVVPTDWPARLVARGKDWWVRAQERPEAIGKSPEPLEARILSNDAATRPSVTLQQIAPGIHEAKIGRRDEWRGSPLIVQRRGSSGEFVMISAPSIPLPEYERFGVDRAHLEAIVRAGGGVIHSHPQSLAEVVAQTESRDYAPIGVYLIGMAAALVMLQAALRLAGRL